jgi:ABC-2 type transport system permease protein
MKPGALVSCELLKLRRSPATWISFLAYGFIGLVAALLVWFAGHPGLAQSLGLVGQKASFASSGVTSDWAGLLALMAELSGLGGMIIYSFIVTYVFGREYAEGTAKNALALPTPRAGIVFAKLAVSGLWFLALSAFLVAEAALAGSLLGLPGFAAALFWREAANILVTACLVLALGPAVAWVAMAGGGYLAPLGFTVFTVVLGTIFGATDWARFIPWSIVALFSGAAGPRAGELGMASYAILAGFFLLCALASALWLERADNTQ